MHLTSTLSFVGIILYYQGVVDVHVQWPRGVSGMFETKVMVYNSPDTKEQRAQGRADDAKKRTHPSMNGTGYPRLKCSRDSHHHHHP
jgi:hypothetical protein